MIRLTLLAFLLCIPLIVFSQTGSTLTASPSLTSTQTAAALIQGVNQRAGWTVDWSTMSFTYTGSITNASGTDTTPVNVVAEFQGRTNAKVTSPSGSSTASSTVNGKSAWVSSANGIYAQPYESLYNSMAIFPFITDLTAISDPVISVSYDGVVSVGAVQANQFTIHRAVAADPSQSADTRVWLALDTMLPLKMESLRKATDNASATIQVQHEYADYKLVNGIMVPFTIRELIGGVPIYTLSISNTQFGVNLPATDFQAAN